MRTAAVIVTALAGLALAGCGGGAKHSTPGHPPLWHSPRRRLRRSQARREARLSGVLTTVSWEAFRQGTFYVRDGVSDPSLLRGVFGVGVGSTGAQGSQSLRKSRLPDAGAGSNVLVLSCRAALVL